jgi:23S rRNA (uracil1939-C5)-methyltransferase
MNNEIEVQIEKIVFGGEGMGHAGGKICFVEGVLPGEKVLARVTEEKSNFIRAKLLKVLNASAERTDPPCPHVSHCGGCQYLPVPACFL